MLTRDELVAARTTWLWRESGLLLLLLTPRPSSVSRTMMALKQHAESRDREIEDMEGTTSRQLRNLTTTQGRRERRGGIRRTKTFLIQCPVCPRQTRLSDTRQEGSYPYTHTGPRPTHIATKPKQAVAVGPGTTPKPPPPYAQLEPEFPSFLSLAGPGCLALSLDKNGLGR